MFEYTILPFLSMMNTDAEANPSPCRLKTLYEIGISFCLLVYRTGNFIRPIRMIDSAPDRSSVLTAKTCAPAVMISS